VRGWPRTLRDLAKAVDAINELCIDLPVRSFVKPIRAVSFGNRVNGLSVNLSMPGTA